jgi:hypothetical protein
LSENRFGELGQATLIVLLIPAFFMPIVGRAQSVSAQTASVSGAVVDDKGHAVPGAILTLGRTIGAKSSTLFNPRTAVSDASGLFVFSKLPPGLYRVCASVLGSDLLDPCEWFPNPPAVFLQAGQSSSGLWVEMKHGKLLDIRLDDATHSLKPNAVGVVNNIAIVRAVSSRGFHVMPKVAEDADGQNHTIAVPVGVALTLDVSSPSLSIVGQGLASAVNASSGTAAIGTSSAPGTSTAQPFQLSASDVNKQFRFVVQAKGN